MNWQEQLSSQHGLSRRQVSLLEKLIWLLQSRSDRGLTAVTGTDNIVNVHFRDSLGLLHIPEVCNSRAAIDIGSGAGFPGLPLALARPDMQVTLLESSRKKCDFLAEAVALLGLKNVSIICSRSETAGRSRWRDSFDLALARALGPLPVAIEYSLPLVKNGGHAVLQRGARQAGDETAAAAAASQVGGALDRVEPVTPYPGAKNLHVWVFKKTAATPEKFPRRPGLAKKRPLV